MSRWRVEKNVPGEGGWRVIDPDGHVWSIPPTHAAAMDVAQHFAQEGAVR